MPSELARKVCRWLKAQGVMPEVLVEPTCGRETPTDNQYSRLSFFCYVVEFSAESLVVGKICGFCRCGDAGESS